MDSHNKYIDHQTLAIQPAFIGSNQSIITKTDGIHHSKSTPRELLEAACLRYFSTMQGRKKAVRKILNYRKPPFIIAPNLGVFPTISPNNPACMWIFNHKFQADEITKGKTLLKFSNGITVPVNASIHTLKQQQQRLHTVLNYYRSTEDDDKFKYFFREMQPENALEKL